MKLFTLSTSSAASERNFSAMGFVHNKLRNKMLPETTSKLVFIKTNFASVVKEYDATDDQEDQNESAFEGDNVVYILDSDSDDDNSFD